MTAPTNKAAVSCREPKDRSANEKLADRIAHSSESDLFVDRFNVGFVSAVERDLIVSTLRQPAGVLPTCVISGRIAGDSDACGDCDPCGAAYAVPEVVKRLLAEKDEWRSKYGEAAAEADARQPAGVSEEIIAAVRFAVAKERECFLPCACNTNPQPQLASCQSVATDIIAAAIAIISRSHGCHATCPKNESCLCEKDAREIIALLNRPPAAGVSEERERCAMLAEGEADEYRRQIDEHNARIKDWTDNDREKGVYLHAKESASRNLAGLIRNGTVPLALNRPPQTGEVERLRAALALGREAVVESFEYAIYVDVRPEVEPTVVADARCLPAEIGEGFDLILFDPPHKNNGETGKMTVNYGHWTAEQIRDIVTGTAREAHRVAKPDALMAFKWNDHTRKLTSVLTWISPWWEPLFGHGMEPQQRGRSLTSWVMLRRRNAETFTLASTERRLQE